MSAIEIVSGVANSNPLPESEFSKLSSRVSAVENDMRQIDTVLGGEEVIPNVETEIVEEDAGNVQTGED